MGDAEENPAVTVNKIPVKVYLPDRSVHRLKVNENPPLKRLHKRINNLHPEYNFDAAFNLCWKDDEGDMIIMSNNDDVTDALRNIDASGLLRVFVMAKGDTAPPPSTPRILAEVPAKKSAGKESFEILDAPAASPDQQERKAKKLAAAQKFEKAKAHEQKMSDDEVDADVHEGAKCRGCDGDIRGIRFKCCVCPDFDLCQPCEVKGVHIEHPMIKFTAEQARMFIRKHGPHKGEFRFGPPAGGRKGQQVQEAATKADDSESDVGTGASSRIEASLQHMLNMGYSNENGWLRTLLASKQGDISAVLDVLQTRVKPIHA